MHIFQRGTKNDGVSLVNTGLPDVLNAIFQNRGIADAGQLNLELGALLPPDSFDGLDDAVQALLPVIKNNQRLLILGDFDVDGATSCAVAVLGFKALGLSQVDFLVPDRFKYGYGLTPEIVELVVEKAPDLLVTVDNGIASVAGVAAANKAGIPVLITDHHLPGRERPDAVAIVNPNLPENRFASKALAGVGVIFYVLLALRSQLRQEGYFVANNIKEPNFAELLDLLALGTVADVVPLDFNNRILVAQGLKRIRAGQCRPGIKALLKIAKRDIQHVGTSDLGFALGPRLNAAGRLDDMSIGIRCLLAESESEAMQYAAQLDSLNQQRREIEADMQATANEIMDNRLSLGEATSNWGISLYEDDWHQGVIGILASRIKDQYHRPVIAFAPADVDTIKGSGRSIPGLHIRDVLDEIASLNPGLIDKFGGHAMAAGLSISKAKFTQFQEQFDAVVKTHLSEEQLQQCVYTDGALDEQNLDLDLAQLIAETSPWGQEFPEPLFDNEFEIVQQRIVGEKHWKLVLKLKESPRLIDAIAFNQVKDHQSPLPLSMRFLYQLDINRFRGNTNVQLNIRHMLSQS